MTDKPNHVTQGMATGLTGKVGWNVSIHWDYLAKRDRCP